MNATAPDTIDAYISAAATEAQQHLQDIRALIRKTAPEATEAISYGLPTFKLKGKNLIHFGAFKAHIGLYPTPNGLDAFKKELSAYQGGKGSVQFPLDQPMPLELIRRITEFRIESVQSATTRKKKA